MTGAWPTETVDHKYRDPDDGRWEHLRAANVSQQNANRCIQMNNTSGEKGVYWHKRANKWAVEIKAYGQKKHLGLYTDFGRACEVRHAAALAAFGEFA